MSIFGKKQSNQVKQAASDKMPEPVSMKDLYGGEGEKAAAAPSRSVKLATRQYADSYRVLVKPLVTEKAAKIGTQNKYAFVVAIAANKIMIARSIEQVYGVKPVKVNIIRLKGKIVSSRRLRGKRKDWKKAIITLPAGKNINIYEGV